MLNTVIVGATPLRHRYAFQAALMLQDHDHPFIPLGRRRGEVLGKEILQIKDEPAIKQVDTLTMYVNPYNQQPWYDYFLSLEPRRIIFNPGSENHDFAILAENKGILVVEACTLVMLSTGQY